MVHADAPPTLEGRLLLAQPVIDDGWPLVRAAERFHVSWPTAKRWATRYLEIGTDGMGDRSSRPHHRPNRTPEPTKRKIVNLRWRKRLSPQAIASRMNMPASAVHAVLVRCRMNPLSHIDIRTGEVIRRYERPHPGSMIHVDVKKLGNIPDGGGWRFAGRKQGRKNRQATPGTNAADTTTSCSVTRSCTPSSMTILASPTPRSTMRKLLSPPPCSVVRWAGSPTVESPSNGSCPTTAAATAPHSGSRPAPNSASNRSTPAPIGRRPTARSNASTAPWPPEWTFARHYQSEHARRTALPEWLHTYNHHQQHSGLLHG